MIVEQLIDDADSPSTTLEWSLCLPGVGFRISLTAKTPRITPIGAQKRKRSLSFATRSNKLSDPRTIIPLTNTHTHTPQRKSCGLLHHLLPLSFSFLLRTVLDGPKTKLSQALYISVAVRKTMPPLQAKHTRSSITGSPPGVLYGYRLLLLYIRFLRPPLCRLSPRMAAPTYGRYESALLGIAFLLQHRCSK